jgi:hypothetical protein
MGIKPANLEGTVMMSPRNAAQIQRNSARSTSDLRRSSVNGSAFPIKPIAYAVGLVLLSTGAQAAGPRPFSGGWFNAKGVSQVGVAPGGQPAAAVPGTPPPLAQQQQANKQLQRSIANRLPRAGSTPTRRRSRRRTAVPSSVSTKPKIRPS